MEIFLLGILILAVLFPGFLRFFVEITMLLVLIFILDVIRRSDPVQPAVTPQSHSQLFDYPSPRHHVPVDLWKYEQ